MSASPVSATFEKTIRYDRESRDYRAELDGELIGWFKTHHAAEVELDRVAYDRLISGDCATATELDGGASDDDTPEPTEVNWNSYHEAADAGAFGPQLAGPPSDPVPDDFPGTDDENGTPQPAFPICRGCNTSEYPPSKLLWSFCTECVNAMLHGLPNRFRAAEEAAKLAHTRQSLAIEARIATCPNCEGIHHVQRCPEIKQALFAPERPETWKDIALGRELLKMRWRRFQAFVALLASVPPSHLVMYADSYVAFVRSHESWSNLTRQDVLKVWTRWIGADRLAA